MASLPGFSLADLQTAKQDAQLAVHGRSFEYVSKTAGISSLTACKAEGAQEGNKYYFVLFAKPGAYAVPPEPGDRILLPEDGGGSTWYVLIETKLENGWQVSTFQRKGPA